MTQTIFRIAFVTIGSFLLAAFCHILGTAPTWECVVTAMAVAAILFAILIFRIMNFNTIRILNETYSKAIVENINIVFTAGIVHAVFAAVAGGLGLWTLQDSFPTAFGIGAEDVRCVCTFIIGYAAAVFGVNGWNVLRLDRDIDRRIAVETAGRN